MRDNWICIGGKWLNLDNVKDIYVSYIDSHSKYGILYSCNPYDKNIKYEVLCKDFEDEDEAQKYLDKLMEI